LCITHHRTGKDSYHKLGPRGFAELHNLDIPAIVGRLNRKPFIRIETGMFIGCWRTNSIFSARPKKESRSRFAGWPGFAKRIDGAETSGLLILLLR